MLTSARSLVLLVVTGTMVHAHQHLFWDEVAKPSRAPGVEEMPVTFNPERVKSLNVESSLEVEVWTEMEDLSAMDVYAFSSDPRTVGVEHRPILFERFNSSHSNSSVRLYGQFLGYSYVFLRAYPKQLRFNFTGDLRNRTILRQSNELIVSCIRINRIWDKIFIYSLATMVPLIYVNFGCALNWDVVKATVKRPIGPAIGFISQFGFMPLISFFLARYMFPGNTAMQLGMFFTGCSPGGGASNIWTVALGGNLDLSITMTTISTFASFAMIPLWVFTLGKIIFEEGNLGVPYRKIFQVSIGLLIPLTIGALIQRYLPRVSKFLIVTMKPFAVFLLIYIIVLGTATNIYLFVLIDWRTMIGGLGVPWLGYMFGAILSRVLMQPGRDIIAIAVETGVQNTGITVYMLRFALGQPEADLALVMPVAVSLMTPIPLAILAVILRLRRCRTEQQEKKGVQRLPSTELTSPASEQAVAPTDRY